MKTIELAIDELENSLYQVEFEKRIKSLKIDFMNLQKYIQKNREESKERKNQFHSQLEGFRTWVSKHNDKLDINQCSSLIAVPSQILEESEKLIHRIWMGGGLPETTKKAMVQWDLAISAINDTAYKSILWVWDAEQLSNDPHFIATGGAGDHTLGSYVFDEHVSHVNSLSSLLSFNAKAYVSAVSLLHDNCYYATLSDYFRFLIMIEFGGIYMDSDTIPYKPATTFLAKPEMPNYCHYVQDDAGEWEVHHLNWMNLFLDETGLIVAKKNNHSLRDILNKLHQQYICLPEDMPHRNRAFELSVFELLYDEWKQHIGCSFISHDELTQTYSVLFNHQTEPVLCGMRGMRLTHDIITGIYFPLDKNEGQSYDSCIANLQNVNWTLDNPLELAKMGDVYAVDEVPRMAYPLQLRSDIKHYHYYNVLSNDNNLDRVNDVFGDFMLANNYQAIELGEYWHEVNSVSAFNAPFLSPASRLMARRAVKFLPGELTSNTDRHQMAKLIFETSYLEYCSAGNTLGLNLIELQKKQNIEPYLSLLQGIYDYQSDNVFLGFVIAGTSTQYDEIDSQYYYRDEMKVVDKAYDDFVMSNLQDSDYFISTVALTHNARGKGIFSQVLKKIKNEALSHDCKRVVLTVYESSDALAIYQKIGFEIIDTFDYVENIFFDKVCFLVLSLDN